jgi:hypothetical protein
MTTPLQAIRGELTVLRPRIELLEQAEALVALAYAPPQARRSRRPARRSRTEHQGSRRAHVREYVVAHGPLSRRQLVDAVGGHPDAISKILKRLLDDGEIAAEGRSRSRRYRAPGPDTPVRDERPQPGSRRTPPARGVYPVYDAIADAGGATTVELAAKMGMPVAIVVEQGRRLVQLGLVRFAGAGGQRQWLPASDAAGDAA